MKSNSVGSILELLNQKQKNSEIVNALINMKENLNEATEFIRVFLDKIFAAFPQLKKLSTNCVLNILRKLQTNPKIAIQKLILTYDSLSKVLIQEVSITLEM